MSYIGKPPCDEPAMLHGAGPTSCAAAARRWTLIVAILGSGMAFVDGTVVNVALPAIQRDLGASAAQAQWVVESYALFLAALMLVGGALGDRFGRRRVFAIGVTVFTIAAAACALSASVNQLIAARAVQGIGGAMLVPGSLALISAAFPQSERGQAIGTWSAFSGIMAALGPVLGGFLVDHYSWSWAFVLNVPIGIALVYLCVRRVPESRGAQSAGGLDLTGAAIFTLALAAIVFAFIEAPVRGWRAPWIAPIALGGVAALALFALVEARTRSPMLSLDLLRNRNFAGTNLMTLLLYAALGGGLFFFPLNLIQVQGYGAASAGAALLPFVAIMFLLSRWAGKLVDRYGARLPLVVGPLIAALGFALFALPSIGGSYVATFLPAVCVLGLGMAVTVAPLTTTVMNSVGPELAGVASGVNNAVSRVAAVLAIAVLGLAMGVVFNAALPKRLATLELPPAMQQAVLEQRGRLAAVAVPDGATATQGAAITGAVAASFVMGFHAVMLLCAGLALMGAAVSWLWIAPQREAEAAGRGASPAGERGQRA